MTEERRSKSAESESQAKAAVAHSRELRQNAQSLLEESKRIVEKATRLRGTLKAKPGRK